jgi:hypothetical protein
VAADGVAVGAHGGAGAARLRAELNGTTQRDHNQCCVRGSTRVLLGTEPIGATRGMISAGTGLSLSDDHHVGDVGRDG